MKTIGIDIGTTSISGVVYDLERNKVIHSLSKEHQSSINTDKEWEKIQDVNILVQISKSILDILLEKTPDCVGIGLTGQMHGILYVDSDGKAISSLFTWQDGRVLEDNLLDTLQKKTQSPVSSGYGLATHIYNLTLVSRIKKW
ncbi:MAG: FGGY family carbohydrate kinase [Bacillota bacterium]|nr:FGGY family carbohydrate kinase [Bacillota bacterium]